MKKWRIWFRRYNEAGEVVGAGVLPNEYKRKSDAVRKAVEHFGPGGRQWLDDHILIPWMVAQENPYAKIEELEIVNKDIIESKQTP